MKHLHELAQTTVASTLELDLDFLPRHRFAHLVAEQALVHAASDSWATDRMKLKPLYEHALSTLRDRHERAALIDIGADVGCDCLVHVSLQRGRIYVFAAARTLDGLRAAKEWLRERYPVLAPAEE